MHRFERHTEYVWEQQSAEYPEYLTLWRETRELIRDVYAVEKERYLSCPASGPGTPHRAFSTGTDHPEHPHEADGSHHRLDALP